MPLITSQAQNIPAVKAAVETKTSSASRYDKSGVKQSSFVVGALRHEDMECDDVTFSALGIDGITERSFQQAK